MLPIQIVLLILAVAYLIYLYLNRNAFHLKKAKADQNLGAVKTELLLAQERFTKIENEISGLISEKFGQQFSADIKNGVVTVGMPAAFLTMAWGHPQKIVTDQKDAAMESWYYRDTGKKGIIQTEVMIRNKRIIALKDI
ncbi:MAG: hypothetical protein QM640_09030 [Niabella sp.]